MSLFWKRLCSSNLKNITNGSWMWMLSSSWVLKDPISHVIRPHKPWMWSLISLEKRGAAQCGSIATDQYRDEKQVSLEFLIYSMTVWKRAARASRLSGVLMCLMWTYSSSIAIWYLRRWRENITILVCHNRLRHASFSTCRLPVFLSSLQRTGLAVSCCNHEISLWTSRWPGRLGGSNWGKAAGFPLQQSHSLPGGWLHSSMRFITLNKPWARFLATAEQITGHNTIQWKTGKKAGENQSYF